MKFDRLSAISEIAKYYGKLDKVFRLLNWLNTRTRKIWANTRVQLSKDITRKSIKFNWSNNYRFIYFLRRNRFALNLFKTTVISPKTTDEMKIVLKLLESVDCPPMAMITIDMILSPERNSYLALSNYIKCMKEIDLSFMELYNKIIDVAINREFQLSLFNCYVFIHEIPNLKDIKYIRSILIPWNRDSDSESLINIWEELWDSKKIEFNDVILIWDDMQLEKFFNIFSAVSNYKIRLLIHANIENIELNKLFEKISLNKLDQFSIKIWRKAEYIMWESTWHINEIWLKNWHYQSPWSHKKVFNFAWCQIKYQNCLNYCDEAKLKITLSQTSFISFSFDLNNSTDPNFIWRSNQIYVNKNELCFDERIINNAKYRTTKEDEIYFIDKPIKATNFFSADIKYIPKECLIVLQITNNPLAMQDIWNLIDCIPSFGNIKMLSLLIQNLSWAIKILKWCMRTDSVTFIHLILVEIFNWYQRFDVELILNQLKLQRKRIQIYSLKDYSDYYKI